MSASPDAIPTAAQPQAHYGGLTVSADDLPWRVLRLLNSARWVLTAALMLIFYAFTDPRIVGASQPFLAATSLTALLVIASIEFVLLYQRIGTIETHINGQAIVDIALITLVMHASGGITTGLGGLLVISIGSLSLLIRGTRAFFLAALATCALLISQTIAISQSFSSTAEFTQSGILGAVLFSIVAATQILRRRVVESEALAEQRGVDLRNLVELNEYIIQHLRESIVVVDKQDHIRLINTSAQKQLTAGVNPTTRALKDVAASLAERLNTWRHGDDDAAATKPVFVANNDVTQLEPHFARLGPNRQSGVLIFLEDTSLIADRVQQTKLAALGRLSASIAHEIRNPLGALSHASQLLGESTSITESDQRLTEIIRVNARRVSNIVDSILALSRRDRTAPQQLELLPWLRDFVTEFVSTMELFEGAVSVTAESRDVDIEIDPTHLHQILWNLCDNAVKYASLEAGAIAVDIYCGMIETTGRPCLEVADRGEGIAKNIVEQVFEPFFTAQAGGTGLGLYISRELSERNGGSLSYYPRPGGGSVFRLVFADPKRWRATANS